MTDADENNEISFSVKFLGRTETRRPDGMETLNKAAEILLKPDKNDKEKNKKNKAYLFLSLSAIDILEHKTKFLIHSCTLESVSFCAVHKTNPKLFGFIAKHPASNTYHCYMFQCKNFSHLVVSLIGDTFKASQKLEDKVKGSRDLVVEALRLRIKALQKENDMLKKRLREKRAEEARQEEAEHSDDESSSTSQTDLSKVRFHSEGDKIPLIRNK
ncbi:PTB domain-containing engulfment adapter protein 1-like [Engraulis encrasicolus]|uniref:PTB domain-containing engulfment adapter protein 1-like n=1 Tax=Engraulis encrasicolus TaxID=184585 RepID=UPI002FD514FF